ncbi:cytoplasmic protein-related [Anaeramoeba ignava]|uniref:Cytoplasmic protein-related n=1 Tax=Anaeramoeba ignava TaxID=1746090 RepID=A0A9Q0LGR5_ANAIG|nr:cytoplasmic protein-related [Anaeramoeba ignava]
MSDLISSFLNKKNLIAIIGASNNQSKYGYIVLKDLITAGFENLIPINLNEKEILGKKAYQSLRNFHETEKKDIDVVITIVPPKITEKVVKECHEMNVKKIWMQPGSENQTAIDFCKENGIDCIHDLCIMIKRKDFEPNSKKEKEN